VTSTPGPSRPLHLNGGAAQEGDSAVDPEEKLATAADDLAALVTSKKQKPARDVVLSALVLRVVRLARVLRSIMSSAVCQASRLSRGHRRTGRHKRRSGEL